MDAFANPPLVVEDALRVAGIAWEPSDNGRVGVFTAQRCPHCHHDGTLVMQWIGDDEFVLTCPGGGSHPDVVAALGIDPDEMPRSARKPDPPQEPEQEPKQLELRLVPLAEFAGREETLAESLLGSTENAALTPGSTIITYGDGGVGKTTLLLDAVAHLAAGVDWLELEVARPLKIVVVENEGPRAPFRRKLKRKAATWEGASFEQNVLVLEEPWAGFSFTNPGLHDALAAACVEFGADLLVLGPLITLGVVGAGTPEDVAKFEAVLEGFRRRVGVPLAVWFAHHENKAGDVSGAWERLPDTLMHVRIEGKERTKLHWRKTRWASSLHDDTWTLRWVTEGEGFEREAHVERDIRSEIVALYEQDPKWRTLSDVAEPKKNGGIGRRRKDVENELNALVAEGEFEFTDEAPGRNKGANCYRPKSVPEPWDNPDNRGVS